MLTVRGGIINRMVQSKLGIAEFRLTDLGNSRYNITKLKISYSDTGLVSHCLHRKSGFNRHLRYDQLRLYLFTPHCSRVNNSSISYIPLRTHSLELQGWTSIIFEVLCRKLRQASPSAWCTTLMQRLYIRPPQADRQPQTDHDRLL